MRNSLIFVIVQGEVETKENNKCLSSYSEDVEFRDAFIDEMTKETDESQIYLNISKHSSDDADFEYKLSGIITHLGNSSTQCGRYIADVYR